MGFYCGNQGIISISSISRYTIFSGCNKAFDGSNNYIVINSNLISRVCKSGNINLLERGYENIKLLYQSLIQYIKT